MGYNARIEQLERGANDSGSALEIVNISIAYDTTDSKYKAFYLSTEDEVTFSDLKNLYDNGKIIYLTDSYDSDENLIMAFGVMTYSNTFIEQFTCGSLIQIGSDLVYGFIAITENSIDIV